jgi:hypothetical protein
MLTSKMNKIKKNPHYVNNKDFHDALINYKIKVNSAKEKGLTNPVIPNYIGDCFLKIATHLSYRPNFVNYMFREDMISDGVENCVQYINNFDVERTNPFAYFTQIVYYAFLRRIQKEKRQMEIKEKILEKSGFDQVFSVDGDRSNSSDYNTIKENIQMKLYQ